MAGQAQRDPATQMCEAQMSLGQAGASSLGGRLKRGPAMTCYFFKFDEG